MISDSFRGFRGGSSYDLELDQRSSSRLYDFPGTENSNFIGFRVASP